MLIDFDNVKNEYEKLNNLYHFCDELSNSIMKIVADAKDKCNIKIVNEVSLGSNK